VRRDKPAQPTDGTTDRGGGLCVLQGWRGECNVSLRIARDEIHVPYV
jgi:hypothetical protein